MITLSAYNLNLTFENIRTITVMFLDIFILWFVIYYALRIIRNNARTIQIFKGVLFVVVIDGLAKFFGLRTVQYLADMFLNWGFLAVILIFQPEIRALLERMGKSNMLSRITTLTGDEKENLVDQIVTAVMLLSADQTGALISIEQVHSLEDYIQTGTRMNSDVTAELLTSIFVTTTPLHDGAVIIQGDKIACASAYFPPTNMDLPSRYGARHRAAIGISEITDAVTIVVSEETGNVSVSQGGQIIQVDRQQLRDYLMRVICGEVTELHGGEQPRTDAKIIIDDKKKNETSKQRTGVFSKLAIKKQEEPVSGKIEVEEVKPAKDAPAAPVAEETPAETHVYESPAVKTKEEEERIQKEADAEAEAAEMKLPHRKPRPKPSYPDQIRHQAEALQAAQAAREAAERKAAVEQAEKAAAENAQKAAAVQSEQTETQRRMTPEEVAAAREASYRQYSRVIRDTDDEKYDTAMLDISKIVGFKDELNETFEMVDQLPDYPERSSDHGKGGTRS